MKKLCVLFVTIFLFSCSKNEEILQVETSESSKAQITPALRTIFQNFVSDDRQNQLLSNRILSSIFKTEAAFGIANNEYNRLGPHRVSTINVERNTCSGLGAIQNFLGYLGIVDPGIQCNEAFPYGYADRRVTEIFYPSDIQSLDKVPVISFVGGLLSNAANYDALINLWTSYGFIVVNSNNFINFSPTLHFTGIQQLAAENNDPQSPLFNKADLSKILVSGHSAGGGGALLITSSLVRPFIRAIDPNINIVGSFPMQASFNATGLSVDAPTLILTGENDVVVIPYLQGLLTQFGLISQSPAWYICTRNSTHLTPTVELARNDYAGITVAFIRYLGQNNADAARYFVGTPYRATEDLAFIQASTAVIPPPSNLIRVQRNNRASSLPTISAPPVIPEVPVRPVVPVIPSLF